MNLPLDREAILDAPNPLGMAGIEFIEFTTPRPQALGQVLEQMGFQARVAPPLARGHALPPGRHEHHRQRPRPAAGHRRSAADRRRGTARARRRRGQRARGRTRRLAGGGEGAADGTAHPGHPRRGQQPRVFRRPLDRLLSIYDVDFVPIPTVDPQVPATEGLHWFGIVQYVGEGRIPDWCEFYASLVGLHRAARRAALRHPARRARAGLALRHVLPAADRAAARRRVCRRRAAAAHRLRQCRRARRGARPAHARCRVRRLGRAASRRTGRPHTRLVRRRDVRAGAPPAKATDAHHPHARQRPRRHRRLWHGHHLAGRPAGWPSCAPSARPASAR